MNIAIIGYGKMGKIIEKIATERNHRIGLIIDINNVFDLNSEKLKDIDCAIEFTSPDTAYNNFIKCFENNVPVVSGTTGWLNKLEDIKRRCKNNNQTFFYASNYSMGVNILFKLNEYLARIMNHIDGYRVSIAETHHTHKLDQPSGTAISLANQINTYNKKTTNWSFNPQSEEEIKMTSNRKGEIVGLHEIKYKSAIDQISLSHEAFSRKGFAKGAIMAAEFVQDKKGFFGMQDLFESFNIY